MVMTCFINNIILKINGKANFRKKICLKCLTLFSFALMTTIVPSENDYLLNVKIYIMGYHVLRYHFNNK